MKKILFILISIISIFFTVDSASALSYTATDNIEYQVKTEKDLLDYCYFTYIKNTDNDILILSYSNLFKLYTCTVSKNMENVVLFGASNNIQFRDKNISYNLPGYRFNNSYLLKQTDSNYQFSINEILYSTNNVYSDINMSSILYEKNTSFDEIESRYGYIIPTYKITYYVNNIVYKTFEVEEGSSFDINSVTYDYNKSTHIFSNWQYDENIDFTNITSDITINATITEKDVQPVYFEFPINKEEFYALLVLLGTLIIMLFLKWCFPFKGGSDLR